MLKRLSIVCCSVVLLALPVLASQPPAGQSEFVPVNEVPASDQLPAAPLLITAYAFVWIALMVYLWTIWRRLGKLETDMRGLEQRRTSGTRR